MTLVQVAVQIRQYTSQSCKQPLRGSLRKHWAQPVTMYERDLYDFRHREILMARGGGTGPEEWWCITIAS